MVNDNILIKDIGLPEVEGMVQIAYADVVGTPESKKKNNIANQPCTNNTN